MEIFRNYLKKNLKIYLLFIMFIAIFCLIFWLYSFPLEVLYIAGSYCFVLSLIVSTIDFLNYRRSYKSLKFLESHVLDDLDKLPESLDIRVHYYHKIIKKLYNHTQELLEKNRSDYNNSVDYYSMWVHQIKTPIAAMSFLLEQEELDKKQLKLELFKIERYTEMVLNYLRLGSESTDYVLEKINLEKVARETLKKFAPLFISKNIKLKFEADAQKNVVSDKKWLAFALEQIISNAIKYSRTNGEVAVKIVENKIIIEDNGIGIKQEDLPRIFDKGFTGFNGRYEKKSSGLGLYLCKKTLDNLGHNIEITSEVNVGTKITITLPMEQVFRD